MKHFAVLFVLVIVVSACTGTQGDQGERVVSHAPLKDLASILSYKTYKVTEPRIDAQAMHYRYQVHDPEMRWLEKSILWKDVDDVKFVGKRGAGYEIEIKVRDKDDVLFQCETKHDALLLMDAIQSLKRQFVSGDLVQRF